MKKYNNPSVFTREQRNKAMSVSDNDLGMFLGSVPGIVSEIFNKLQLESGRIPQFRSVFKYVKEESASCGYFWDYLTDSQKYELEEMARDSYEGIRYC